MLRLFLNNTELEVPEDVSIPITLKNPIFNKMGSYSLSFSLKRTAINDVAFSFPSRIERSGKRTLKYSNFKIQFEHYQINCSINVTEPDSVGYKINCQIDEGDFYSLIQNINMPDVTYDGDVVIGATMSDVLAHAKACVEGDITSTNYQFPQVWNNTFYEGYPLNSTGIINDWDSVNARFNENYYTGDPDLYFRITTLVPYPYLFYVLKKLCAHFNYIPQGNLFDNVDLQHLIIHNNYALDKADKRYYVRASATTVFHYTPAGWHAAIVDDDFTLPNEDADGLYNIDVLDGRYYFSPSVDAGYRFYSIITFANVVEDIYMNLEEDNGGNLTIVATNVIHANGTFYIENYVDAHLGCTYIYTFSNTGGNVFDITAFELSILNVHNSNVNIFDKIINIKNHVPNIKASDFVDAIENAFGCIALVNNNSREVNFKFLKDILTSTEIEDITAIIEDTHLFYDTDKIGKFSFGVTGSVIDFSIYQLLGIYAKKDDIPGPYEIGQIAICLNIQTIFISYITTVFKLEWKVFCDYHHPYVIGEGEEISAKLGPLTQSYFHSYVLNGLEKVNKQIIPVAHEKGISNKYNTNSTKSPFLITYYYGIDVYPTAHPSLFLNDGTQVRTLDLAWDGDYGLFKQFWAEWVYWYNNIREGVKRIIHWTPILLNQLEWDKKYRIKNINYFVDSIELNLTKHKIVIGETKLLKC